MTTDYILKNQNTSEFDLIKNIDWHDRLFLFLQNIFSLYPDDKFFSLIKETHLNSNSDSKIYSNTQKSLSKIKPFLQPLSHALPALKVQKSVIASQTKEILSSKKMNGYLEIGSIGRYIKPLKRSLNLSGSVYLSNDISPGFDPASLMERGGFKKSGVFFDLNNYDPISETTIPSESLDLVTCYIGLHHCPLERLENYIKSIHRMLRKNGSFILRDHDAPKNSPMFTFASLIHTVFNIGTGVSVESNLDEIRNFRGIDSWSELINQIGFEDQGKRILQKNDPTLNTLMHFTKR